MYVTRFREPTVIVAQREPVPPASEPLSLRGMDLREQFADPGRRQRFVTRMFDIIAPRYDRFTRVFSYDMDASWKQELLSFLPSLANGEIAADLACGTGDLALAVAGRSPGASVIGVDASARMIEQARERGHSAGVAFGVGDMIRLPFADGSLRALTVGYGFRNVPDWGVAVAEAARVLAPGGTLLVLDFYRPRSALWRALFLGYLRVAGHLIGWLWHGEGIVYGYIAPSIAAFVDAETFAGALREKGFEVAAVREKLWGGVALHAARRQRRVAT